MTTPTVDVHLQPERPGAPPCAPTCATGLTADAQGAAAEVVLRRRGAASSSTRSPACPSTTRPGASARSSSATPPRSPRASGADTLVELGSGTSEKTRLLLDALADGGTLRALRALRRERDRPCGTRPPTLAARVPVDRTCTPWSATSSTTSACCPAAGAGWSPSSAAPSATSTRRAQARSSPSWPRGLAPGDGLLLGTDLVKDAGRLVAAYDDAAGRHRRVQPQRAARPQPRARRRLRPRPLRPRGLCDPDKEWIEMHLRAARDPRGARRRARPARSTFAAGEEMRTEISAKFRRAGVEAELAAAGLELDRVVDRPRRRLRPLPVRSALTVDRFWRSAAPLRT